MVTFLDNEKQVLKYMNFGGDTNKAATEASVKVRGSLDTPCF